MAGEKRSRIYNVHSPDGFRYRVLAPISPVHPVTPVPHVPPVPPVAPVAISNAPRGAPPPSGPSLDAEDPAFEVDVGKDLVDAPPAVPMASAPSNCALHKDQGSRETSPALIVDPSPPSSPHHTAHDSLPSPASKRQPAQHSPPRSPGAGTVPDPDPRPVVGVADCINSRDNVLSRRAATTVARRTLEVEKRRRYLRHLPNHEQMQHLLRDVIRAVAVDAETAAVNADAESTSSPQILQRLSQLERPFLDLVDKHAADGTLTTKRVKRNAEATELDQRTSSLLSIKQRLAAEQLQWDTAVDNLESFFKSAAAPTPVDRPSPEPISSMDIVPDLTSQITKAHRRLVTNTDRIEECVRRAILIQARTEQSCVDKSTRLKQRAVAGYDVNSSAQALLRPAVSEAPEVTCESSSPAASQTNPENPSPAADEQLGPQ